MTTGLRRRAGIPAIELMIEPRLATTTTTVNADYAFKAIVAIEPCGIESEGE